MGIIETCEHNTQTQKTLKISFDRHLISTFIFKTFDKIFVLEETDVAIISYKVHQ